MTTFDGDAKTPELPWPFTGREEELDIVRRSLAAGRPGIVVTGPAGCGKTRLVAQAVGGTDCARVTGTPEARRIPFAAFAHLLPEAVTLHRAVHLLSGVRLLLVDDAHLLDDASAALVHQLAAHARTRLLVVAADDAPVPGAVSRLWTGELLPRLALKALPRAETAQLLTLGGSGPEPLTADRLHRLCGGDLRLLRDLLGALRDHGGPAPSRLPSAGTAVPLHAPEAEEWAWRGPLPLTAAVRERSARVLDGARGEERQILEQVAFAEPVPLHADNLDLRVLEALEAEGLVHVDADRTVRLAHPLHGPALRAAAGRLRAGRLARTPEQCATALRAERAALTHRIEQADVRRLPTPVGEWLVDEGAPVPAGYAAVRARFSRLRGELREAAAWAREGLRHAPGDPDCRAEHALAAAQSGEVTADRAARADRPVTDASRAWLLAAQGDLDQAVEAAAVVAEDRRNPYGDVAFLLHDLVRLGAPERAAGRLAELPGAGPAVLARHADALVRGDGAALDRAAEALRERGLLLCAAEAHAQAAGAHRDPRAARVSRTRAVALARRCQGARTPALAGLVLGELTARQRQIVTLAATGLSNRQIAERLTLSVRTVGNHLHGAYTRLGASDRAALPWLVDQPEPRTA
ncbi:LuxR C-terminal-related transcriptional regulator [Streptomyces sp. NPDC046197]|uniref:LuxR family transcriptional regulator AbsR2 n=1 Tax=Streptomyces sp. NPDC046197 TaxID=3154337 RepID=UPI0033C8C305